MWSDLQPSGPEPAENRLGSRSEAEPFSTATVRLVAWCEDWSMRAPRAPVSLSGGRCPILGSSSPTASLLPVLPTGLHNFVEQGIVFELPGEALPPGTALVGGFRPGRPYKPYQGPFKRGGRPDSGCSYR